VPIGLGSRDCEAERIGYRSRWDCGRDEICREFEVARAVLVVDEDPLVLEVTADMLKDLGCEVVRAASGPDALERLSENATDLNMPGMDGYELAQRAAPPGPDCK
jgi:response regulator RpfG family c-di-GMP phosphodiesterase